MTQRIETNPSWANTLAISLTVSLTMLGGLTAVVLHLESKIEKRIEILEERFAASDARWEARFATSDAKTEERFAKMDDKWFELFKHLDQKIENKR